MVPQSASAKQVGGIQEAEHSVSHLHDAEEVVFRSGKSFRGHVPWRSVKKAWVAKNM